jgi:putative membrane protein
MKKKPGASFLESLIQEAERRCAAEFAIVVAHRSDEYTAGIATGILLAQSLIVVVHYLLDITDIGGQWHPLYAAETLAFLIMAVGLLVFGLLSFWHQARVRLASRALIIRKVREAALAIFAENALFNTSHRRTVLIYISELERRIDLVVDTGLSHILTEAEIMYFEERGSRALARSFSDETIRKLVYELADKIAQGGFPPDGNQANELADKPVMR